MALVKGCLCVTKRGFTKIRKFAAGSRLDWVVSVYGTGSYTDETTQPRDLLYVNSISECTVYAACVSKR
jgi:hypothetical protein